ncbi:MAG: tRNA (adenosine(37)-N6)-threonylcarbamoyltransferase complex ATPase subunit type 1 TsaE [Xanthomonadales bacterium]|nr:tRNA (adenosine(37)-N6)-threonylcarbamoyltransferase complex ATPase subunit type 1 TsaE [Xanthomonadales bacterium]
MRVDESQMCAVAAQLASKITMPFVLYLQGDLGAGKTTFARALLRALGHSGTVKSPTYGLLEFYELPALSVLHLDLYRIEHPEEIEYLGLDDLFNDNTLMIVEWPEKGAGALPPSDMVIRFTHQGTLRELEFTPPRVP